KDYHTDIDFMKADDGTIHFWNLYNLFTEANKSTYIDVNFERNTNAYEFVQYLTNFKSNEINNWYLY
ncbi:MAG: DUF3871 family protein, partial [Algoriella sp.]